MKIIINKLAYCPKKTIYNMNIVNLIDMEELTFFHINIFISIYYIINI